MFCNWNVRSLSSWRTWQKYVETTNLNLIHIYIYYIFLLLYQDVHIYTYVFCFFLLCKSTKFGIYFRTLFFLIFTRSNNIGNSSSIILYIYYIWFSNDGVCGWNLVIKRLDATESPILIEVYSSNAYARHKEKR